MIPGFEDIYDEVKIEDNDLVNGIAAALKKFNIGKEKAITNKEMCERIFKWNGIKLTDAQMRKYIQYIRIQGLCPRLCATKKGYYIAETKQEWHSYKEGFRKRSRVMQMTLAGMELFE